MPMTENSINQLKPLSFKLDAENKISLGGISLEDLVAKYGSPLYLMCEETIRKRAQAYKNAFDNEYPNALVIYASKAFNNLAMCKIMAKEGMGLDVVSGGELYTALKAGFPTDRIIFHGNNKSKAEVEMAVENGVTFILDNLLELSFIEAATKKLSKKAKVMIRVTPGIECHTHEYIKTGKIDSKFGFNLEDVEAVVERVLKNEDIELLGLHAHIGSQIFETIPHRDTCRVMLDLYKKIKDKFDYEMPDLNVGGGLGIMYQESDDPPEIADWVKIITDAVKEFAKEFSLKEPRILVEPGRSMCAPAGMTVYRVGNIKDIPGVRKYVAVDGGMADNVRPIMYQAEYTADIDGKVGSSDTENVTVAGKYCESGDILIRDIKMAKAEAGDLLVVYSTGAYNYSMASNYNRANKPAVVLVKDGESHVIVERESHDDLLRNDLVPDYLA